MINKISLHLQASDIPVIQALQTYYKELEPFSSNGKDVTSVVSPYIPQNLTTDTVTEFFTKSGFVIYEVKENLVAHGIKNNERLFFAFVRPYAIELGIGYTEVTAFIKFENSEFRSISAKLDIHSL